MELEEKKERARGEENGKSTRKGFKMEMDMNALKEEMEQK